MQPTKESLIKDALQLPAAERVAVVEALAESIGESFFETPETEAAWVKEVKRRVDRGRAGDAELTPGDQAMSQAWEKARGRFREVC